MVTPGKLRQRRWLGGACLLAAIVLPAVTMRLLLSPGRTIRTGVVRNDVVRSSGKQYRRLVRVDRKAGDVVTTIRFTDAAGGVGEAVYVQPLMPAEPDWPI